MAMTIRTEGLTELSEMLARLGDKAQDVASGALFDGAGVVADAFTAAVGSIRTAPFRYAGPGQKRLPSPEEKAALIGKSGVAKFQKTTDEVNTLIGISGAAGYADIAGKPKAVREIARSINSGTSFMDKQPVFRRVQSSSQEAAKAAIVGKAEALFDEIIKG
jgi:hypothetical protein